MLNQDYTTKILGLEDVIVTNVENIHDELPEKNTFLPRYHRLTNRLTACIIRSFEKLIPAKEIGERFNVSGATTMRYFRYVNFKPRKLPKVLSLDES